MARIIKRIIEVYCSVDEDENENDCMNNETISDLCIGETCGHKDICIRCNEIALSDYDGNVIKSLSLDTDMLDGADYEQGLHLRQVWSEICSSKIQEAYDEFGHYKNNFLKKDDLN